MHREFSATLRLHLQLWAAEKGLSIASLDPLVESCPYPDEGELSSPLVFDLAKRFPPHQPADIAAALISIHQESVLRGLFSITIAGGGYLNARVTPSFITEYFKKLCVEPNSVDCLFRSESFVVGPIENKESLPLFTISWSKLWGEAQQHADSDIQKFAAARGGSTTKEDRLMLLSLLGDPELEAEPYLQDLAGRQNVPWYIKRFFSDFERASGQWSGGDIGAWGTVSAEVMPFCLKLLAFRSEMLRAYRRSDDGGIIALVSTLGLIRQFYGYFNNPRYRSGSGGPVLNSQLDSLTRCVRGIVRTVLRLLPLAPDSSV